MAAQVFSTAEARSAFKRAIEAVENASAVEVVVAVRQRSGTYRHANVIVGAMVAFAGLATVLYSSHEFQLSSILIDPFVVGILAGALVELLPGIKRLLTPRAWRRREVERSARATFLERGVHTTTGRSGVLVYISWLEQEIALIADDRPRACAYPRVRFATGPSASSPASVLRGGAAGRTARLEALARRR